METRRWTNPSQPQTLQIAVWLLYFHAALSLLFQSSVYFRLGIGGLGALVAIGALVGMGAAGFGIANERKWGYQLAVGLTVVEVLLLFAKAGGIGVLRPGLLLDFMFAIARAALLLHPLSRNYQRIWFK
ncbi:MAG: hypothetical protein ACKVWR_10785 [Acidimicrobiales bacterium]